MLCAIAAPDARAALIAAANHDGDSDSTAAICGNLLGAAHGAGVFPAEWLAEFELRDTIETLAGDLAASLADDFDAEAFSQRYPGW